MSYYYSNHAYRALRAVGKNKLKRRYRKWFIERYGPGRIYLPGETSDGAW